MTSPEPLRILVAGCGYVGTAAGVFARRRGHEVFGVRRRTLELPAEIEPVAMDLIDGDLAALPDALDAVVWAVSPGRDVDSYRSTYVDGPARLLEFLAGRGDPVRHAALVSSTGVWSREDGAWVDESTPVAPAGASADAIVAGERAFADAPFDTVSLRFGGIYGPGRVRLIDRVRRGEVAPPIDRRFGNRIWRDDGATAIVTVLEQVQPLAHECLVVVDDQPTDRREMLAWLAAELGVDLPEPSEPTGRSRSSKRCRNSALRQLGWTPQCPDYRAGYRALLATLDD